MDLYALTNTGSYRVIVRHITVPAVHGGSTRTYAINVQAASAVTVEYADNSVTCSSDAYACQGLAAQGAGAIVHNNHIVLEHNSLAEQDSQADSARGLMCDGNDPQNQGICELHSNFVEGGGNNRAVRSRGRRTWAHDNLFADCGPSCIHLYDGYGSSEPADQDQTGTIIEHNTFASPSGFLLMARGGHGGVVRDNVATGDLSGAVGFANLRCDATAAGYVTDITLKRNPVLATPNLTLEAGATASYCDSGTVGGPGAAGATLIDCATP